MVTEGFPRKCSKGQGIEAGSFLRAGPRDRPDTTLVVIAATEPTLIEGEQIDTHFPR